jgi:predicted DNA-binding transcriptional regulator AlpA
MIHRCRDYALQRSQSVISLDAVTDPVALAARIGSGGMTFPKPVDLGKHRHSGFVWMSISSVWFKP